MKLLYFAWMRQRIGTGEENLAKSDDIATVADLIAHLKAKGPGYAAAFQNPAVIKVAINQDYADFTSPIAEGDEIAFFPPVTGG
ncbi:MAG: molybdopterin converting factor subunit 1 [Alphaproteobacteria bacterium]|nr:MAG: molybdopterin converting factor subunit 1 [Alphaproteobacteria bacterium]